MEKDPFSPSKPKESEPSTAIQRIVGARLSEDARKRILEERMRRSEQQEHFEWKQHEVPKTPEQVELIGVVNSATAELLRQNGREVLDIPPEHYHVIDEKGWKALRLRVESGGAYSMEDQAILIRADEDPVVFAMAAYHEALHFKSYQALQRLYPGKEIVPYRRGFEIIARHGHRSHFRLLDEAVVQELSHRFIGEQLAEYPLTRDAVAASERRRNLILRHRDKLSKESARLLEELVPYVAEVPRGVEEVFSQSDPPAEQLRRAFNDCKFRGAFIRSYANEVQNLRDLVDQIYENNRDGFKDREEVFNLFVAAILTGNVLSIGRVIEKTFGKGSFRRLGKGEDIRPPKPKPAS